MMMMISIKISMIDVLKYNMIYTILVCCLLYRLVGWVVPLWLTWQKVLPSHQESIAVNCRHLQATFCRSCSTWKTLAKSKWWVSLYFMVNLILPFWQVAWSSEMGFIVLAAFSQNWTWSNFTFYQKKDSIGKIKIEAVADKSHWEVK